MPKRTKTQEGVGLYAGAKSSRGRGLFAGRGYNEPIGRTPINGFGFTSGTLLPISHQARETNASLAHFRQKSFR